MTPKNKEKSANLKIKIQKETIKLQIVKKK